MTTQFKDRAEAGRELAKRLTSLANRNDVLVLALPRGGVPVAAEVAKELNAPLDVFLVRKLGLPEHPELAMGAIATGGVLVINRDVVERLQIHELVIDAVVAQEQEELARRQKAYRDDLPAPNVRGKTVIVVDDGIATGATVMAAVAALRQLGAGHIVVASPVIARSTFCQIHDAADEVAAVIAPQQFYGVGQWYEDFSQTTDDEVRRLLAETNHRSEAIAA
jgi:predicted phosphoribosyltransferase